MFLVLVCLSQLLTLSSGNQMRPCWWLPSSVSSTPMPSDTAQTGHKRQRWKLQGWWHDVALCLACDFMIAGPWLLNWRFSQCTGYVSHQRISIVQPSHETNEVSCSISNSKCGFSLEVKPTMEWDKPKHGAATGSYNSYRERSATFSLRREVPCQNLWVQLPSTVSNLPLVGSNMFQLSPTVPNSQPGRHFASSATKLWRRRAWPPSHGLVHTMFTPSSHDVHTWDLEFHASQLTWS